MKDGCRIRKEMVTAPSRFAQRRRSLLAAFLLLLPACDDSSRIDLPAPTGSRVLDRQTISDAFERVEPGGTIAFDAGTYVIGGEWLLLRTPGVTLLGHPDGTTLFGCTAEEVELFTPDEFWEGCVGITLAREAQTVSDLRFESFATGLSIRDPAAVGPPDQQPSFNGGHVIEDNMFEKVNSFYIQLAADSAVWIRRNVFRNTWHAVAMGGSNIRFVDNDISVLAPEQVYQGYPGGAVGLRPDENGVCESVLVEGNRIEGYTEGVMIGVFPQDMPGSSCSNVTVRGNEIVMRPVHFPIDDPRFSSTDQEARAGKLAIAPAIRVVNFQPLVGDGTLSWPEFWIPEGGWPPELSQGRLYDVTVEGNRIRGAVGIAIEVVDVTDSQILDNEIEVRPAVTPAEREGLTLGGNAGPGVWVRLGLVDDINGTPVWVSPGSDRVVVRNPQ